MRIQSQKSLKFDIDQTTPDLWRALKKKTGRLWSRTKKKGAPKRTPTPTERLRNLLNGTFAPKQHIR
jgi:hypothetical protein